MSAGEALRVHMERVRALHERRLTEPSLQRRLLILARWQAARLEATYVDLGSKARYRAAMDFFLGDLYGPRDFSRRDSELERVAPMMSSMLPASVLATIAHAVEVNGLSTELDIDMVERLGDLVPQDRPVTVASYCEAYRASGREADRRRQIELIAEVGAALDRYVRMPFLYSALLLMRVPARAAGFGELQDFLERGFGAFRGMGGADEFLGTIVSRERLILERIIGGDDAPFPEPQAGF
jgi:hypothetical protein